MVAVGGGWDVLGWAVMDDPDMGCKVMKYLLNHAHHPDCGLGHDNVNVQLLFPANTQTGDTGDTTMTQLSKMCHRVIHKYFRMSARNI